MTPSTSSRTLVLGNLLRERKTRRWCRHFSAASVTIPILGFYVLDILYKLFFILFKKYHNYLSGDICDMTCLKPSQCSTEWHLTCSRLTGFPGNGYVDANTRRVSSIPQTFHFQRILMIYPLLDFHASTTLIQAVKPERHLQDPTHVRHPETLSPYGDNQAPHGHHCVSNWV